MFAGASGGCATSSEFFAQLPGFEARSDTVPGLTPPLERRKAIREKGEKGAKAPAAEQDILMGQLLEEYRKSPDKNIRREVVEAMAKISHKTRDGCLREALRDEDAFVRISACRGLGEKTGGTVSGDGISRLETLRDVMKTDPDKDVRMVAMKMLGQNARAIRKGDIKGQFGPKLDEITLDIGAQLDDKAPAVRYQAMISLQECTGMNYGTEFDRWVDYIEYKAGRAAEAPAELTWAERIEVPRLPMF